MSKRLLMLATMAFIAFNVLTAMAVGSVFHSELKETRVIGEQVAQNKITTPAGVIKCKTAKYDSISPQVGTGSGTNWTTTMVTVHPTYGGCTAFGQEALVNTSTCDYTLSANGAAGIFEIVNTEAGGTIGGKCEIVVTVTAASCEVVIPSQKPGNPLVEFETQAGPPKSILATWKIEELEYTTSGGVCGTAGKATLAGTVQLKGFDPLAVKGVSYWWE